MKLILKDKTYAIRGAAFDVYRIMGCGFLEAMYQECIEKELRQRKIPFVSQPELKLNYKEERLKQVYKPDIICYGKIIVELKAVKDIAQKHKAQIERFVL